MNRNIIVTLLVVLELSGCTTMKPLNTLDPDATTALNAGDHIVVYETSGRMLDMTLTGVEGDTLKGSLTDAHLTPVSVRVSDVERLEIEKVDAVKSTLATVGTVVVVVPLAALALLVGGASALPQ
jgi:hypothetical protein